MMARSTTLQTDAGYIDARPLPPIRRIFSQRTAGPYIKVTRLANYHPLHKTALVGPVRRSRRAPALTDATRASNVPCMTPSMVGQWTATIFGSRMAMGTAAS